MQIRFVPSHRKFDETNSNLNSKFKMSFKRHIIISCFTLCKDKVYSDVKSQVL